MAEATVMDPFGSDGVTERAVAIARLRPVGRLVFRGRPAAIAAAGTAFGLALPEEACRAARTQGRAALWLGPDEWLLLMAQGEAESCSAALDQALAGLPRALVDIGHRQVAIEVAGREAATVINAGCPLDLDPAVFPVGMCTRTVFFKVEIVLWRLEPERFRIEVWRSFSAYVLGLLGEAAREFDGKTAA